MKQVQINTILPKNIRDSKNGLDYTLHGDYYLPDLSPSEYDSIPLGRWGREYKQYLESNRPGLYTRLILSDKLYPVLHDLDCQAQERCELIIYQMKTAEGITETLKVQDSSNVKAPEFSHTPGRIYAVVKDGQLKHLAYYDAEHKQAVSIDFAHPHKGVQPHRHVYLSHDKNSPGVPPTANEWALINKIRKEFHLR